MNSSILGIFWINLPALEERDVTFLVTSEIPDRRDGISQTLEPLGNLYPLLRTQEKLAIRAKLVGHLLPLYHRKATSWHLPAPGLLAVRPKLPEIEKSYIIIITQPGQVY